MTIATGNVGVPRTGGKEGRLSYKFQRLRESIRQAVLSGQLSGKLPGERELAKQFNANPKTLSKALTDLAAEGLLDRSIGRGTYVRGSQPESGREVGRWLVVCDAEQAHGPMAAQLLRTHPEVVVVSEVASLRPSFISQFDAVIDLGQSSPESFYRNVLVRGMPVVRVGNEPAGIKVHAVVLDRAEAAVRIGRELLLAGHRQITAVEPAQDNTVSTGLRRAAERYAPEAKIQSVPTEGLGALHCDVGAIVCDGVETAWKVLDLAGTGASVAAIGVCGEQPPCSGVYVSPAELETTACELLREASVHRPVLMWLMGRFVDRGSIHAVPEGLAAMSA